MSLPSLKHIPCPAGSGCTAFKCLFRHDDETVDGAPSATATDIATATTTTASTTTVAAPLPPPATIPLQLKSKRAASPFTAAEEEPQYKRSKIDVLGPALAQSTDVSNASASASVFASAPASEPVSTPVAAFSSADSQPTKVVPASKAPITPLATSSGPRSRPAITSGLAHEPKSAPRLSTATGTAITTAAAATLKPPTPPSKFSASTSSLSVAKKQLQPSLKQSPATQPSPTSAASSQSTSLSDEKSAPQRRPSAPPRPKKGVILTPAKVPVDPISFSGRLKVIQMLHAEFVRLDDLLRKAHPDRTDLFLSQQEADKMALNVEATVAAGPTAVYRNIVGSRLSGYKKMTLDSWVKDRDAANNPVKPKSGTNSGSIPKTIDTGLTAEQEAFIAGFLLTPINNLARHGYVPVAPTEAQIAQAGHAVTMSKGWEKCHRCEKRFQVFPSRRPEDGALTTGGSCTHHPGRMYYPESSSNFGGRSRGRGERKYRCCHQAVGDSAGCTVSEHHVFRVSDPPRLAHVLQFATTPKNDAPATSAKVVCFDCEMCYTVHGLELVRLTATAWPSGDIILDVLVRPQGSILDLNSRYSGVYPEHLSNAQMWSGFEDPIPAPGPGEKTVVRSGELKMVSSPAAARDLLFSLITPETILIGHGLENDLNITRIIHPRVIDTVLLFPHRAGLPVRNGLKALASSHLNRQIQVDDGSDQGHDSAEDARTAGELVRLKVQEKWRLMQAKGWKLVGGNFVAP